MATNSNDSYQAGDRVRSTRWGMTGTVREVGGTLEVAWDNTPRGWGDELDIVPGLEKA